MVHMAIDGGFGVKPGEIQAMANPPKCHHFGYKYGNLLLGGLFHKLWCDSDIGLAEHLFDEDQFAGIVAFDGVAQEL